MFQQVTKGIKISVKTKYNGNVFRGADTFYTFSYFITIENKSESTVQLLERFWVIHDALNNPEYVNGKGVVGQTPVIKPNGVYSYKSNCLLISPIGAMSGKYKMVNTHSFESFSVTIPTFQLVTLPTLN